MQRMTVGILGSILVLVGCGLDRGDHPLAVANVSPRVLCEGDNHATPITLSADGSMPIAVIPGLPQPENRCIKTMAWSITGSSYDLVSGELTCTLPCPNLEVECAAEISLTGERSAMVTLTVTNDRGATDMAKTPIAITLGEECE